MASSSYNPSLNLESLLSSDIAADSERFLLFIKAYYEWLQSSKIEFTGLTGTFQRGETVIGDDSGFKGVITEVGVDYLVLKITGTRPALQNETFTGQTSAAVATISRIKDNVVRKSGNVLDYRTINNSIDDYVVYLSDELYPSIPLDYYGDKRLIANKFKDFFQSKSNEDSYRFLFRLLFNEEIDFYYPGEDLLRVSDGNYEKTQIIRVTAAAYGIDALGVQYERNVFDFLNKTIEGQTSGFLANVVDIKKFFIGSSEVAEFTLKLVSGAFVGGETITATDDENLNATTYGIVSGFTIVDGGSGYALGDEIAISGDGVSAAARVSSIKESPISALSVDATGYGYRLNTLATIDNTGTGGSGLIVKVTGIDKTYTVTSGNNSYTVGEISQVSVISRGENYFKTPSITLQDTTIASLGLLTPNLITIANTGTNYGVGNSLVFTGGSGGAAAGIVAAVEETTTYDFLFEDGQRMIVDGSYEDILKNEDWNVLGPIARIELTNFGTAYTNASLPTITVNTTTGSGANLIATGIQGTSAEISVDVANNIAGIGSIRALEITNFGIDYTTATANASATGDGNANLTPIISGLATREGTWIDDDGKIDYKYIQDSYFYQDFSYVIKSGLGFEFYRETLKKIIHPAGLQLFGEILIRDVIDVTPDIVTDVEILRNFERVIVQILSMFTVGAEYEYSRITWSIKVEPDVINTSITKPESHEYVLHLVPEGDDITGITDVGMSTPQSDANVRKYRIEVYPVSDVTADVVAPQSFKKMIVNTTDTHYGFTESTYGSLPIGGSAVYDDYSDVEISELAGFRFSDLTSEYPARQNVYTIFDKYPVVADLTTNNYTEYVLDVYSKGTKERAIFEVPLSLESETQISVFANDHFEEVYDTSESLTIPVSPSPLATGQSEHGQEPDDVFRTTLDIRYASFIDASAVPAWSNVLADFVTTSTELDREIPITIQFDVATSVRKEYSVVVSPTASFTDVAVVFSSATPQKFKSAEGIVSAYGIKMQDVIIGDISNDTFNNTTAEVAYQNLDTPYANTTFGEFYRTFPDSRTEMTQKVITIKDNSVNFDINREIVVSYMASGLRLRAYYDTPVSEISSENFSTLGNENFEIYFDTVTDSAISVFPSPLSTGQAIRTKESTDVFRTEMIQKIGTTVPITAETLAETKLSDAGSDTIDGYLPDSVNRGLSTTYAQSNFNAYFRTYSKVTAEMVRKFGNEFSVEIPSNQNREIVVSYSASGFKYRTYGEVSMSAYSSDSLSEFENNQFNEILDTVSDITIKASPSPLSTGIGNGKNSLREDVFAGEFIVKPQTLSNVYDTQYEDLRIDLIDEFTFESVVPATDGVLFQNQTFSDDYSQAPTSFADYIKYAKIGGTVSSSQIQISNLTLQAYLETPISLADEDDFSDYASVVVGTGTNFASDYDLYDVFEANNEYFVVESVANTTHLIVDRFPENSYSGVSAYKQTV